MHKLTFDVSKTILYEEVTSSGLKVIVAPIEKTELTIGGIYVSCGGLRHEEKIDKTRVSQGCAYLLSRILNKTAAFDVKEKLKEHGALYDVDMDYSSTVYSFVTTSELKECLDLLLGQCTNFSLTDSIVENSKQEILSELEEVKPFDIIKQEVLNNLYFSSKIKEDIKGGIEGIKDVHLSSLKKYFGNKYNIENLTLFVVGKVDIKEIDEYLKSRKLVGERKPNGKREEIVNKEEYGSVVYPSTKIKVENQKKSLAFGIKFLPRMELYERYRDNCFAFYELFPLIISRNILNYLGLPSNTDIDYELKEGGEDTYFVMNISFDYDDYALERVRTYLTSLAKKIKKKEFRYVQKIYEGERMKDFGEPFKYFKGLTRAFENHIAYPSLVERTTSISFKAFKSFLKDVQSWIYTTVEINAEDNK